MGLGKLKDFFIRTRRLLVKKGATLPPEARNSFLQKLTQLQNALLLSQKKEAKDHKKDLQLLLDAFFPKHPLRSFFEFTLSLIGALAIAFVIRQTWFEPYEIPSGSMRPTFLEGDRLVVSKNQFSLNYLLSPGHFYIDPNRLERMQIVTFTGKEMDIAHSETRYFYIFPGHKEYVKRLIGMPGDSLYFYGGKIYGVNQEGGDITPLLQPNNLSYLEHIPFIQMERVQRKAVAAEAGGGTDFIFSQIHTPLGSIHLQHGMMRKNFFSSDDLDIHNLWGMDGFGMAKLLRAEELPLRLQKPKLPNGETAPFYLEIIHHPTLRHARFDRDLVYGAQRPILGHSTSYIPLDRSHLEKIFASLYTSRFEVTGGYAHREGAPLPPAHLAKNLLPYLGNIPDGRYEFQDGKLYRIGFQSIRTELHDHPLAQLDLDRLQALFNCGIELDKRVLVEGSYNLSAHHPARYAYFRNGSLYLMGHPLFTPNDPELTAFIESELHKGSLSSPLYSYHPFIDQGPPLLEDGSLDRAKILQYGFKVPEGHYLLLGDNHANSGDSREFGCVPLANLRGTPSFTFWAPGSGFFWSSSLAWFSVTKIFTWFVALIIYFAWYTHRERQLRKPLTLWEIATKKTV